MNTYKFWNPHLVSSCTSDRRHGVITLDPETCTAAELTAVEDSINGNMSTTIQLNDDAQAAAVAALIEMEWNGEPRYEQIQPSTTN